MRIRNLTCLKFMVVVVALCSILIAGVTAVSAYDYYYGTWAEQPYFGNWFWENDGQGHTTWTTDDLWSASAVGWMQWWRTQPWPWPEFRIEQEAYKPGQSPSSCDRLVPIEGDTIDLPYVSYSLENGCGSSSYLEELKIELDEDNFNPNGQWGGHWVKYQQYGSGSGEVNYSFTADIWPSDSWLGKLYYDGSFNKTSTDKQYLVQ